jgi:hypothetical protein
MLSLNFPCPAFSYQGRSGKQRKFRGWHQRAGRAFLARRVNKNTEDQAHIIVVEVSAQG